jgi:pilus assembly protein Flp/PilA
MAEQERDDGRVVDEAFFAEGRENRAMAWRGTGRDGNPGVGGPRGSRPGETPPGAGWAPAQLPPGEAGPLHTTRPGYRGKEDTMKELWNNFLADESGQGLVEYVLIIALVSVGLILILIAFRGQIADVFRAIGGELDNATLDQEQP